MWRGNHWVSVLFVPVQMAPFSLPLLQRVLVAPMSIRSPALVGLSIDSRMWDVCSTLMNDNCGNEEAAFLERPSLLIPHPVYPLVGMMGNLLAPPV